jgi:hypothetical protein
MPSRNVIIASILTLIGVGGLIAGGFLVRQRQTIERQAAVPGGRAEVSILPASGSFDVGETIPVSLYFNTDGVSISGILVTMAYQFTGSTPEVRATNININPSLLSSGDWNCPTADVTEQGNNVNIEISCGDVSASGFSSTSNTLLATFDLIIDRTPATVPFSIRFDSSNSVITQKSNGQDILGIPSSEGTYSIGGAVVPTNTPTPEVTEAVPLVTTIITPTSVVTASPTLIITKTPTATDSAVLIDAGISFPTIAALGIGLLAIFASLIMAL